MSKMNFGLIGYPLSHTFSPEYFNQKFNTLGIEASYNAYPLEKIEDLTALLESSQFHGLNVTIPYKESVMTYLDEIDEVAKAIGAVNTILFRQNKLIGYNTDVFGFESSLTNFIPDIHTLKGAMILGSGGGSKAVRYVLQKLEIPNITVSRTRGDLTYDDITSSTLKMYPLIINTTPLGMYPHVSSCPNIPYKRLNKNNLLFDLIYNPQKTLFLTEGMIQHCKTINGFEMLIFQAEKSFQIWTDEIRNF